MAMGFSKAMSFTPASTPAWISGNLMCGRVQKIKTSGWVDLRRRAASVSTVFTPNI
jgi:hypothetical protein